ncbi:hypothetical protein Pla52n_06900 [Stieleria varia]|uniref:Uncharacterized protein n=1 Tax=Stieleria varia TaxID=2528005 RepID=A0A5C6B9W1_9BACT|nr:hypothetical protein Pla52n_06900 [Stieleria varia]
MIPRLLLLAIFTAMTNFSLSDDLWVAVGCGGRRMVSVDGVL